MRAYEDHWRFPTSHTMHQLCSNLRGSKCTGKALRWASTAQNEYLGGLNLPSTTLPANYFKEVGLRGRPSEAYRESRVGPGVELGGSR